jgi:GNAT superfamily N-acetyltransferase
MPIEIQKALLSHEEEMQSLFLGGAGRKMHDPLSLLKEFPATVAFDGVKMIGFAVTNRFAPDILELANIFVSAEFRNKNIGSFLLNFLESQIKETDYKALILVNSDLYKNRDSKRSAENFYLKNGYRLSFQTADSKVFYKNLASSDS